MSKKKHNDQLPVRMSLLVDGDGLRMEIRCETSRTLFFEAKIPPKDFCAMLGRLAEVKVKGTVRQLDRVGKKMEMDTLEFALPENANFFNRKQVAAECASQLCPEGWEPDNYFSSQESFFQQEGVKKARTTIRRWV